MTITRFQVFLWKRELKKVDGFVWWAGQGENGLCSHGGRSRARIKWRPVKHWSQWLQQGGILLTSPHWLHTNSLSRWVNMWSSRRKVKELSKWNDSDSQCLLKVQGSRAAKPLSRNWMWVEKIKKMSGTTRCCWYRERGECCKHTVQLH